MVQKLFWSEANEFCRVPDIQHSFFFEVLTVIEYCQTIFDIFAPLIFPRFYFFGLRTAFFHSALQYFRPSLLETQTSRIPSLLHSELAVLYAYNILISFCRRIPSALMAMYWTETQRNLIRWC